MKLYTKTGDSGTTSLFGGQRVSKDHARVDAYGTVDELNSVLGWCIAATGQQDEPIKRAITDIQSRLFEIGADLATPETDDEQGSSATRFVPRIEQRHVDELETLIDEASGQLPEMTTFILPGGSELACRLHMARTVCRRAERACVGLKHLEPIGEEVVIYLNRLSDLLFAWARLANHVAGIEDVPWISPRKSDESN